MTVIYFANEIGELGKRKRKEKETYAKPTGNRLETGLGLRPEVAHHLAAATGIEAGGNTGRQPVPSGRRDRLKSGHLAAIWRPSGGPNWHQNRLKNRAGDLCHLAAPGGSRRGAI